MNWKLKKQILRQDILGPLAAVVVVGLIVVVDLTLVAEG
jgi:hypothetical protein